MDANTEVKRARLEYKSKNAQERHETFRWIAGCVAVASIICTITVSICVYSLEAVKHPVQVEQTTNYDRN